MGVHSEADLHAKHVQACDESYLIGAANARDSYLSIERIIDTAKRSRADAIHPGYGFLSENADFARACEEAEIVFIGPSSTVIDLMADKGHAKQVAKEAGLPLIPGYDGPNQEETWLALQAQEIGYPIMIKARKGGGGRGLRVVRQAEDFLDALASCRREALTGFGDDTVMIEKYIENPRHIEVQIFGDHHGNVIHLFERDCSVQRRHQKIIEEGPAVGLSQTQRSNLGLAARNLANRVGYVGAGTVECIMDSNGQFYFLEMNTRLQVEHGITESVVGHDLVEWQLRVARNEKLPVFQSDIALNGHCFEARICSERPAKGFLPSVGKVEIFNLPECVEFTHEGSLRVDSAIRTGDTVSPHYDSMIAKLMVSAPTREQARQKMLTALNRIEIRGVQTNIEFLKSIFNHEQFEKGSVDTGFVEANLKELLGIA